MTGLQPTEEVPAIDKGNLSSTFPLGWTVTTFGELFEFKGGSQPPKKDFHNEPGDGLIRLLQIRDFASNKYPVYIDNADKWPKCNEDDIMIARYGASLGRILTGLAGAYNVALVRMIFDKNNFDTNWVKYFLTSDHFQQPIHLLSRSAQNGFNKNDVAPIRVELPPLAEQTRIVSKIESLQARSSKTRAQLAEVKPLIAQLRQSVLRSAFNGSLTADWRAKQYAASSNGSTQSGDAKHETANELLQRIRVERRERWETAQLAEFEAKGKEPSKGWRDKYKEPAYDAELPMHCELEYLEAYIELIATNDKIRFKKAEVAQGYDAVRALAPKVWPIAKLGEIFAFIDYRGKNPKKSNSGHRLITAKNIRMGYLNDGRVGNWRVTRRHVSSPRHVQRSMRFSRTTLS